MSGRTRPVGKRQLFDRLAVEVLAGDAAWGERGDMQFCWYVLKNDGIYFSPYALEWLSSSERSGIDESVNADRAERLAIWRTVTGGKWSTGERDALLRLPCTLVEFLNFEARVMLFSEGVLAADETDQDQVVAGIAALNEGAGKLANALIAAARARAMHGPPGIERKGREPFFQGFPANPAWYAADGVIRPEHLHKYEKARAAWIATRRESYPRRSATEEQAPAADLPQHVGRQNASAWLARHPAALRLARHHNGSAREAFDALRALGDSNPSAPFGKGVGQNLGKLVLKPLRRAIALGTFQTHCWPLLRESAQAGEDQGEG